MRFPMTPNLEKEAFPNLNAWWACHLVASLIEGGVRHVCVSPGSRSTPLVHALEVCTGLWRAPVRVTVHHDERAASFFALGVAKTSGTPVALVCTSGTALAHYMPAVIEASLTGIPLVVVSADRPLELRGSGASQTIDQHDLFGVHVRVSREVPAARPAAAAVRRMRASVADALARATGPDAGPVHLNIPFDEPLAPLVDPGFQVPADATLEPLAPSRFGVSAPLRHGHLELYDVDLQALEADWSVQTGVFVVGPLARPVPGLVELARRLGWPVWADVASQLRDVSGVIVTADLLSRAGRLFDLDSPPSRVVQIGMVPTSSAIARGLEALAGSRPVQDGPGALQILSLLSHPARQDPQALADRTLVVDLDSFFERLLAMLSLASSDRPGIRTAPAPADDLETRLAATPAFRSREAHAVHRACRILPEECNLVLASSMPIRYAEALSGHLPHGTRVVVNRGANGIDGLVSTTLGVAHASDRPTLAILGDVAMLHDVGGLVAVREVREPVVFLVLNNDGGGIFSHLPVHRVESLFERYFGTPHGLNFEGVANMYGLAYTRTVDVDAAIRAVQMGLARDSGATLVELVTNRATERDAFRQDLADLLDLESPGEPRP